MGITPQLDILCLGSSFLQATDQFSSLVFKIIKKKLPYYCRDSPVKWIPRLSGSKMRPGSAADHSPPSSAAVMEE